MAEDQSKTTKTLTHPLTGDEVIIDTNTGREVTRQLTAWNTCEHEWILSGHDHDQPLEQVECIKCRCPGERQKDGEVFWPTT